MKPLFADTFYFLALLSPDDPAHGKAVSVTAKLRARMVTTAWVLVEVADAMAAPENRGLFVALLDGLNNNPNVTIAPWEDDQRESKSRSGSHGIHLISTAQKR